MKRNFVLFFIAAVASILVISCSSSSNGMDITYKIKVQEKDFLIYASESNKDSLFLKAISTADSLYGSDSSDYFQLFEKSLMMLDSTDNLVHYFLTKKLSEKIHPDMSNQAVLSVLKSEFDKCVLEIMSALEKRLAECDLNSFKIEKLNESGIIMAELRGVENPDRIKNILQRAGNVAFYETYENNEIFPLLETFSQGLVKKEKAKSEISDTDSSDTFTESPLFSILEPAYYTDENGDSILSTGPVVGYCPVKDTGRVNELFSSPLAGKIFPREIKFVWSLSNFQSIDGSAEFELVAIKTRQGEPAISGDYIINAEKKSYPSGPPEVTMVMNPEGARLWKKLTAENISRSIAIMIDGKLFSFPTVMNEISSGKTSISGGNFTEEEAEDVALIIKYHTPLATKIIEEKIVKKAQ